MEHLDYLAEQTAAVYVAGDLAEARQDDFEIHMMNCTECVGDVEQWRAIKRLLPEVRTATPGWRVVFSEWQMAASLLGFGVLGGWLARGTISSDLDTAQTVVFNLPSVSRGADECAPVRFAADTRIALIRVTGASRMLPIIALDSGRQQLPSGRYTTRYQPDGSQLVSLESLLLTNSTVFLETRRTDGTSEPLGCISGQLVETKEPRR